MNYKAFPMLAALAIKASIGRSYFNRNGREVFAKIGKDFFCDNQRDLRETF